MVVKKMVIRFKETIELSATEQASLSNIYSLMKKIVNESRDKNTQDIARDIVDGLEEIMDKMIYSGSCSC
jgi:hypothetical protein